MGISGVCGSGWGRMGRAWGRAAGGAALLACSLVLLAAPQGCNALAPQQQRDIAGQPQTIKVGQRLVQLSMDARGGGYADEDNYENRNNQEYDVDVSDEELERFANPPQQRMAQQEHIGVWSVAAYTLLMAVATGLGAVPFFFVRKLDRHWLGCCNALASGVMLAASFGLIQEGMEIVSREGGHWRLFLGIMSGLVFIILSQKYVEGHDMEMGDLKGLDARKAMLVVGIMTLHSFSEGLGVGVSYGGDNGRQQGIFMTLAIGIHNIPEGLAVALVSVPRGENPWRASLWAVCSSLPQPLIAVPSFFFVQLFSFLLPIGLGCAAGTMLWMVFAELIPDALKDTSSETVGTVTTLAITAQLGMQAMLKDSIWSLACGCGYNGCGFNVSGCRRRKRTPSEGRAPHVSWGFASFEPRR